MNPVLERKQFAPNTAKGFSKGFRKFLFLHERARERERKREKQQHIKTTSKSTTNNFYNTIGTMFGLGKLFYVIVLTINGIAVLSEDRFLNRIGWGSTTSQQNNGNIQAQFNQFNTGMENGEGSIKTKLINLISAVRTLMRIPLIVVNLFIIIYELILG